MSRTEITRKYCALEAKLEHIAFSMGKSVKQLTQEFKEQPESIRTLLRPILLEQLEYLQTMQGWYYQEYSNVSVFPITRLRRG